MNTLASPATDFERLVRQRRATPHFTAEPVPASEIEAALRDAAEAPSGYNLQPWRFLVLRDAGKRAALRRAAYDQEKITEAPVVIVALAPREAWKQTAERVMREKARRAGRPEEEGLKVLPAAVGFVETLPRAVWLNRHVMIAFTFLMLAFEARGWDTAPMEGFDAAAVRQALGLPADVEVVALLAVGRAKGEEPAHPGRLPLAETVFDDSYGHPWESGD